MDVFKSENLLLPLKLCQDKLQKQKKNSLPSEEGRSELTQDLQKGRK